MRILFTGDTVGELGIEMLDEYLPQIKHDYKPQITICNGENATVQGRGINQKVYKAMMKAGADVITLGNHAWNNSEIFDFIDQTPHLIRPLNFPGKNVPGNGIADVNVNGHHVIIINLQARIFMDPLDDPFQVIDQALTDLKVKDPIVFIDFHGETTSEKSAMAQYLDGRISALVGTHTHVQTNDGRILPNGTAFMTDAGMTGPYEGVLGMKYEGVIKRFLTQRPTRFEVENHGPGILSGCVIDINDQSGKATKIQNILISPDHPYQN